MFAVMKTGGKQYRVRTGDTLRVEKLAALTGEKVQFNDVLFVGGEKPKLGTPLVEGAAVQAEVVDIIKADKVITFHKRRRKHSSQRTRGHRQTLTVLKITDILATGAETTGVKVALGAASIPSAEIKTAKAAAKVAKPARPAIAAKPAPKAAKPAAAAKPKAVAKAKPAAKPAAKPKAAKPAAKAKAAAAKAPAAPKSKAKE